MTVPTILAALALQAMSDPQALLVLSDLVMESGWRRDDSVHRALHPSPDWAKRLAARALFESWPTMMRDWPVVARCWTSTVDPSRRMARIHELLRAGLLTSDEAAAKLQEMGFE